MNNLLQQHGAIDGDDGDEMHSSEWIWNGEDEGDSFVSLMTVVAASSRQE